MSRRKQKASRAKAAKRKQHRQSRRMAAESARPPYVVLPGERVVTFFFRMHRTLGWPVNDSIQLTADVSPRLRSFLEDVVGGHVDMPSSEIMVASILFHEVPENVAESSSLAATMRAYRLGFPAGSTPVEDEPEPTMADVTVAEVVVPLKASWALGQFEADLPAEDLPDLTDPPEDLLHAAMDTALEAVRSLQSMHIAALRQPLKLLTREQLPVMVPYGVRDISRAPDDGGSGGLLLVNDRVERFGSSGELSPEQRALVTATRHQPPRLRAYTDLYNQACVALRIEGNTRESAVMIGAASESFLNLLMLLLRWEAGCTPEQSADTWPDALVSRIRAELPHRVGGDWSPSGENAFARWFRSTYELRNRVAHGGHEPSRADCELAIGELDGLISDVGSRLTAGPRLRRFPRVATMLFGARLKPRLSSLSWLETLQGDPSEANWLETSGRWIDAHYRLVRDGVEARSPDARRSELLSLWPKGASEPDSWVVIDPTTGLAAEAVVDPEKVVMPSSRKLPKLPGGPNAQPGRYVVAHARRDGDVARTGPWVEAYHPNELVGVMVDRSDSSQPWPVHPVAGPSPG